MTITSHMDNFYSTVVTNLHENSSKDFISETEESHKCFEMTRENKWQNSHFQVNYPFNTELQHRQT